MRLRRLLPLFFLLFSSYGYSQLHQVVNEYYGAWSTGEEVYRIFAELQDPTDFVSSVFGHDNNPLYIGSDVGGIMNDGNGSVLGDALPLNFCMFVADVCNDSYVTIGHAGTDAGVTYYYDGVTPLENGQGISAFSTLPTSSALSDSFGGAGILQDLVLEDGSWFGTNTPGANAQGLPFGPDNRVLIAQVAVPVGATLEYQLNIQIFDEAVGLNNLVYVWDENAVEPEDNEIYGGNLGLDSSIPIEIQCCTDITACNYESVCNNPNNDLCNFNDACGVCGGSGTIPGCTDSTAPNYNSAADCDDGSCGFPVTFSVDMNCAEFVDGLSFSEVAVTGPGVGWCGECLPLTNAGNGIWTGTFDLPPGEFIYKYITDNWANQEDLIGLPCADDTDGVSYANRVLDPTTTTLSEDIYGLCSLCSEPYGCTNPTACNYDDEAIIDDGSCLFTDACGVCGGFGTIQGCTDPGADNYNPAADCDNGTCLYGGCPGGSCITSITPQQSDLDQVLEVTITGFGTNFLQTSITGLAIHQNSETFLPILSTSVVSNTQIDATIAVPANADVGLYDVSYDIYIPLSNGFEVIGGPLSGCTDPGACNYDSIYEIDDGSCTYPGCTDTAANNYDSTAGCDDGSCDYACDPPSNNNCINAIAIDCFPDDPEILAGSVECSNNLDYPATVNCNPNPPNGVWYTFQGTGDFHTVSTCNSSADTQIDIFTGSCGNMICAQDVEPSPNAGDYLTEVDDNNEFDCQSADPNDAHISFISDPLLTYYVHVSTGNDLDGFVFTLMHECEIASAGCEDPGSCNFVPGATVIDCDYTSCTCAEAGCAAAGSPFYIEMYDSLADGWNGATWEVADGSGNVHALGTLDDGNFGVDVFCLCTDNCYFLSVGGGNWDSEISWVLYNEQDQQVLIGGAPETDLQFQVGSNCFIPGCLNSLACNFNPIATTDDGSCCFENCYTFNVGSGHFENEITWELYSQDQAVNFDTPLYSGAAPTTQNFCLPADCYLLSLNDSAGDGWNGAVYSIEDDSTGEVVATGTLEDGTSDIHYVNLGATFCAPGCTDTVACNFDSEATVDDGSCMYGDNTITLNLTTDCWPEENAWTLYDGDGNVLVENGTLEPESLHVTLFCLDPGCYTFEITDAFGDGLSGLVDSHCNIDGYYAAYDEEGALLFEIVEGADFGFSATHEFCIGPALGCTNSLANNYDSQATEDDGSCVFCPILNLSLSLDMTDAGGDGWNGAQFEITDLDDGSIVEVGDIDTAEIGDGSSVGEDHFCLPYGCYSISASGGSADAQIGITLTDQFGEIIYSGGSLETGYQFTLGPTNCDLEGCMDSACNNYNPNATTDDGSCLCPPANDACQDATLLNCGVALEGSLAAATPDDQQLLDCSADQMGVQPGVWYTFQGTGDFAIVTAATTEDSPWQIGIYTGLGCGTLSCSTTTVTPGVIGGSNLTLQMETTQSETYYVYVTSPDALSQFLISLDCLPCSSPVNDSCDGAIDIAVGNTTESSLCCGGAGSASCAEGWSYGTWYVVNSAGLPDIGFDLTNISGLDLGLSIYEGSTVEGCHDWTEIHCCMANAVGCSGSLALFTTVSANTFYYFHLWTTQPAFCGDFELLLEDNIPGCTDPGACNYSSSATSNDGSCDYVSCDIYPENIDCANAVALGCTSSYTGSLYNAEIDYGVYGWYDCSNDPGAGVWFTFEGDGFLHTLSTCDSDADTEINIYTSSDGTCSGQFACAQDALSGAYLSATQSPGCGNDVSLNFTTDFGETYFVYLSGSEDISYAYTITHECAVAVAGCTDPSACNYWEPANFDDGSCDFLSCVCDACAGGSGEGYYMEMTDSGGDGWDGAQYLIFNSFGEIVASGSIAGASGTDYFCLCETDCFVIAVGGGNSDTEIGWALYDASDNAIDSGSGTSGGEFCSAVAIPGCTDSTACNFSLSATVDDGTCSFPGCNDSSAVNYDSTAGCDDGTCEYEADLDGDGDVDIDDLLAVLGDFTCTVDCEGDVNGDGVVNIFDILLILIGMGG